MTRCVAAILQEKIRRHTCLLTQVYPDQSLYPANSVPAHVKRINNALQRADQIEHAEGGAKKDCYVPIVAYADAGFRGPLNCFKLMKAMIEAGAAGVHFEDQLASEKKCGHLGGKVNVCVVSLQSMESASCSSMHSCPALRQTSSPYLTALNRQLLSMEATIPVLSAVDVPPFMWISLYGS